METRSTWVAMLLMAVMVSGCESDSPGLETMDSLDLEVVEADGSLVLTKASTKKIEDWVASAGGDREVATRLRIRDSDGKVIREITASSLDDLLARAGEEASLELEAMQSDMDELMKTLAAGQMPPGVDTSEWRDAAPRIDSLFKLLDSLGAVWEEGGK